MSADPGFCPHDRAPMTFSPLIVEAIFQVGKDHSSWQFQCFNSGVGS
jgi:hypothetical protein